MGLFLKTTVEDVDLTNNPKVVKLNGIELPHDVVFSLDGEKVIVESKILDGVAVYEKILRRPYEIDFEFTAREVENQTTFLDFTALGLPAKNFIFPQNVGADIFNNIWFPDKIVSLENTFLNYLGITEVVIKKIAFNGVRGSKNLPMRITALENYTGVNSNETSLIKE